MRTDNISGLKSLDYAVLQQCMHCGMCLPTCPTYEETKVERNSPRGRISLMRAIADSDLDITGDFADEMYYCLGCLACQTACPAGVDYAGMFETARAEIESTGILNTPKRRFWRWLTLDLLFTRPRLLHFAARLTRFAQATGLDKLGRLVIPQHLIASAPKIAPKFSHQLIRQDEHPDPAAGPPHPVPTRRVGLLTGCIQDIAYASINRDTCDVLLANNCHVFTPRHQTCCGSLHAHNGDLATARQLAIDLMARFSPLEELDAIITNAGGCGSHLKHFSSLFTADLQHVHDARVWDEKVKDIHEYLVEIKFRPPIPSGPSSPPVTAAYHASCHLHHGQRITEAPCQILNAIPNLTLVHLPESDWCCGSAGIYNITQPEQAQKLLDRKINNIRTAFAPAVDNSASGSIRVLVVATANPGCDLQITNGLRNTPHLAHIQVAHPVTLLAQAYRAEASSG